MAHEDEYICCGGNMYLRKPSTQINYSVMCCITQQFNLTPNGPS